MAIYMVTFDNPIKILSVHIFYCKKNSKTIFLLARIIILKKNSGWLLFILVPDNSYLVFTKLVSQKTFKNWVKYLNPSLFKLYFSATMQFIYVVRFSWNGWYLLLQYMN